MISKDRPFIRVGEWIINTQQIAWVKVQGNEVSIGVVGRESIRLQSADQANEFLEAVDVLIANTARSTNSRAL